MSANNGYTTQKDVGCCCDVFWIVMFAIFCILMFAAVDFVWDWAF